MKLYLLALALFIPAAAHAQDPLAPLKDHQRVLLVFARTSQDPRFHTQMTNLDPKAMTDRDLVVIPVLANWQKQDDPLRQAHAPYTADAAQAALRNRFHIASADFTAILLGKDGGEKIRSKIPIAAPQLNALIDAMPMRQQEMKAAGTR